VEVSLLTGQTILLLPCGRYTLRMKMLQKLLFVALAGLCLPAFAQWQWIDKDGRKVFSDRAPPPDIQDRNILKRPGGRVPAVTMPADIVDDAALPSLASSAPAAKPSGLDKDLEARKKQALEAEQAKRKVEEEQATKARIENCARAKQAKATYESGARIGRINSSGQQEVMDDVTRAEEMKRIQGIIARDCR
jgi:hypothetical protein